MSGQKENSGISMKETILLRNVSTKSSESDGLGFRETLPAKRHLPLAA